MTQTDPRSPAMPRTKIVATVGPSCSEPEKLERLARAGASVFRLNFSHGDHPAHEEALRAVRAISERIGRPLAVLADLSGPKLRIRDGVGIAVRLEPGMRIILTSEPVQEDQLRFQVNFAGLHELVKPGQPIRIDDGLIQLHVDAVEGTDVACVVENQEPVPLRPRKGVNLPGAHLPIPALTDKDRLDLEFALGIGVDFVALSFVRSVADLELAREAMRACGRTAPLIAKIEQQEALDDLEAIIESADGIMVARGDLGIEIPVERVPREQTRIIKLCNARAKPVIVATQMLNSMITSPAPTRAEVTDIYNAIHAGADAVMLSGETASGLYPVESVEMMGKVAREAEADLEWSRPSLWEARHGGDEAVSQSVTAAGVALAAMLGLDAIVAPTTSGRNAMQVSSLRPRCRVLAFSVDETVVRRLCLSWGVEPGSMADLWETEMENGEMDAILSSSLRAGRSQGMLADGMRVVVVAGAPPGIVGTTNFLRMLTVGEG